MRMIYLSSGHYIHTEKLIVKLSLLSNSEVLCQHYSNQWKRKTLILTIIYYCWLVFSKWKIFSNLLLIFSNEIGGGRMLSFWREGFGRLQLGRIYLLRFKVFQHGSMDMISNWENESTRESVAVCIVQHMCFFHSSSCLANLKIYEVTGKKIEMAFFKFIVPSCCCELPGWSVTPLFIN